MSRRHKQETCWWLTAETSLLYRETRRVSVEWCLVKPDWWGLRSEFEERYSFIRARTFRSVSLDRNDRFEMGRYLDRFSLSRDKYKVTSTWIGRIDMSFAHAQ